MTRKKNLTAGCLVASLPFLLQCKSERQFGDEPSTGGDAGSAGSSSSAGNSSSGSSGAGRSSETSADNTATSSAATSGATGGATGGSSVSDPSGTSSPANGSETDEWAESSSETNADSSGTTWDDASSGSGSTGTDGCGAGEVDCSGQCIAANACCDDEDCPEGGSCDDGQCSCPDNTHECDGVCVSNDSVDSCGVACTACAVPEGGEATCDGTSCGALCPSGKELCLGECIDSGAACNGTCDSGKHECGGLCVNDEDPTKCGTDCTNCPVPANADAVCESGSCDFECRTTFKACGSACVPATGCCTSNECTSPPGPTCVDSNTLRTFSASGTCGGGACSYTQSTDTYCAGGCANNACQHDVWIATNLSGAPGSRSVHTAVWAGDLSPPKMIVWGGNHTGGGLYDPKTNSWESVNTSGAPPNLWNAASVWTGTQMVVFGGSENAGTSNAGGRYTPGSGGGTWQSMSTTSAAPARQYHTAVWTGAQVIVAGGTSNSGATIQRDAYVYDPATDAWSKWNSSSFNNEAPRANHCAVWTGSQMILFGGNDEAGETYTSNTGQIFDPNTRSTFPIPALATSGMTARSRMPCVWSGTQLIVWGGDADSGTLNTGGRIAPTASSWTALPAGNAPSERARHTAVWTGTEMIVWGGLDSDSSPLATGAKYNPATNTWTPIASAPFGRYGHTAVWTGNEMIVWGGNDAGAPLQTGYKYVP